MLKKNYVLAPANIVLKSPCPDTVYSTGPIEVPDEIDEKI